MVSVYYYSKDLAAEIKQPALPPKPTSYSADAAKCVGIFLRAVADTFAKGACCRRYHKDLVEDMDHAE